MRSFHKITALRASLPIRYEMYQGAQHLVAPVVLIVEGVHNDIFYSAAEIEASAPAWNGVPIPVNHPEIDGEHVSVNEPGIFDHQVIGTLFNVGYDIERHGLVGEMWIDLARARRIAPEVVVMIENDGHLEVSTGLFTTDRQVNGTWHDETYGVEVFNFRPDHLAALPQSIGACSFADGCGVRANEIAAVTERAVQALQKLGIDTTDVPRLARELVDTHLKNMGSQNMKMNNKRVQKLHIADHPDNPGRHIATPITLDVHVHMNEASHEDVAQNLQRYADGLDNPMWVHWVRDVFDDYFVYTANSRAEGAPERKLFRRDYTANAETGEVTIAEIDPIEVREKREYVPVTNEATPTVAEASKPEAANKESDMKTEDRIAALIACDKNTYTEEDAPWLGTLNECAIKRLEENTGAEEAPAGDPPAEGAPVTEPTTEPARTEPTPAESPAEPEGGGEPEEAKTLEQYLDEAPEAISDFMRSGVAMAESVKANAVKGLLANKACEYSNDELEAMSLRDLEKLAKLAHVEVDYSGQNPAVNANADNDVPPMPLAFPEKKTA